jgi:iron-sulfur cluster repair protein YtfE (RIC family)
VGDGDHLMMVHDHLRHELAQLRELVAEVEAGRTGVGAARAAISELTLRQHDWRVGAYCAQYCRLVTMHHTLEDQMMYPRLLAQDPGLGPAIDRMLEEHHTVHGRLEDVDRALVALADGTEGALAGLRAALEALETELLAHLAYEEEQLVGPLNRFGFGL